MSARNMPGIVPKSTVVIGLGGTGLNILVALYRRLKEAEEAGGPPLCELLLIDPDPPGSVLPPNVFCPVDVPNIFGLGTSGDSRYCWVPPEEELKKIEQRREKLPGCGGSRVHGRATFFTNLHTMIEPAISRVTRRAKQNAGDAGAIDVYIVGSLAGGTCTGMFLDTAALTKYVCQQAGTVHSVHGLFFLAEVFVNDPGPPKFARTLLRANTYAALKELDFFISGHRFEADYGNGVAANIANAQADFLFETVYLLDRENQKNQQVQSKEELAEIAADALFHLSTTEAGKPTASLVPNIPSLGVYRSFMGRRTVYSSLGFATLCFPVEKALEAAQHHAVEDLLDCLFPVVDTANGRQQKTLQRERARLCLRGGRDPVSGTRWRGDLSLLKVASTGQVFSQGSDPLPESARLESLVRVKSRQTGLLPLANIQSCFMDLMSDGKWDSYRQQQRAKQERSLKTFETQLRKRIDDLSRTEDIEFITQYLRELKTHLRILSHELTKSMTGDRLRIADPEVLKVDETEDLANQQSSFLIGLIDKIPGALFRRLKARTFELFLHEGFQNACMNLQEAVDKKESLARYEMAEELMGPPESGVSSSRNFIEIINAVVEEKSTLNEAQKKLDSEVQDKIKNCRAFIDVHPHREHFVYAGISSRDIERFYRDVYCRAVDVKDLAEKFLDAEHPQVLQVGGKALTQESFLSKENTQGLVEALAAFIHQKAAESSEYEKVAKTGFAVQHGFFKMRPVPHISEPFDTLETKSWPFIKLVDLAEPLEQLTCFSSVGISREQIDRDGFLWENEINLTPSEGINFVKSGDRGGFNQVSIMFLRIGFAVNQIQMLERWYQAYRNADIPVHTMGEESRRFPEPYCCAEWSVKEDELKPLLLLAQQCGIISEKEGGHSDAGNAQMPFFYDGVSYHDLKAHTMSEAVTQLKNDPLLAAEIRNMVVSKFVDQDKKEEISIAERIDDQSIPLCIRNVLKYFG